MRRLLVIFLSIGFTWGALPNGTTWEVRNAGADTNGGGFITGSSGTDFSQQAAAQIAYTDMVLGTGGTTYTSVLNPVASNLVGNIIQIISGSGCTGGANAWYEVVSVTGIIATLDRSAGTVASVCTSNLGGALQTLAQLNVVFNQTNNLNQIGWVKADAIYTISSGVTWNFFGGGGSGGYAQISGYTTTRGDGGFAHVQPSTGMTMFTMAANNNLFQFTFRNFTIDCNLVASCSALVISDAGNVGENILAENFTNGGININTIAGTTAGCRFCYATGGTSGVSTAAFQLAATNSNQSNFCIVCLAVSNASPGFSILGGTCTYCIAANNTGTLSDGFVTAGFNSPFQLVNCVSYKNGRDGWRFSNFPSGFAGNPTVMNMIFYGNGGVGINNQSGTTIPAGAFFMNFNAYGANTGGNYNGVSAGGSDVILSVDPFVNGTGNNFALNSTTGGGTALKGKGYPGALVIGGTGVLAIGALQPGASAPAASMFAFPIIQ